MRETSPNLILFTNLSQADIYCDAPPPKMQSSPPVRHNQSLLFVTATGRAFRIPRYITMVFSISFELQGPPCPHQPLPWIKSTLEIARCCPLVIQSCSNFLGLFQVIMANPEKTYSCSDTSPDPNEPTISLCIDERGWPSHL